MGSKIVDEDLGNVGEDWERVYEGLGNACEGSGSAWGCQSVWRETLMNASGCESPGGLRVGMETSSGRRASGSQLEEWWSASCARGSESEVSEGSGGSWTWPASPGGSGCP